MSNSNKIRLVDAIRVYESINGRTHDNLTSRTTRRELNGLLDLPLDTSIGELREMFDVNYIKEGRSRNGPPKSSILIDVLTGRETHFSSLCDLERYMDCGANYERLSTIVDEGCILTVMGRDRYLVPNRDVDLLALEQCSSNAVVVRCMLRYMGYEVSNCNSPMEMFNMVGLTIPPGTRIRDRKIMRRLCEFVGKTHTPHSRHDRRDTAPRRTTLYSIHSPSSTV